MKPPGEDVVPEVVLVVPGKGERRKERKKKMDRDNLLDGDHGSG